MTILHFSECRVITPSETITMRIRAYSYSLRVRHKVISFFVARITDFIYFNFSIDIKYILDRIILYIFVFFIKSHFCGKIDG